MDEIGPVDYMVVGFPGNQFTGEIAPALGKLVDDGIIRIIDIAFVGKDEAGNTVAMELTELAPDVQSALDDLGVEVGGLLNEDDLMDAADGLEPNSSAALLVWENVWAREAAQKMRDAGGVLLAFERIPHEVVQAAREWVLEQAANA
jgi:translation initiation factor IF-2